MTGSDEDSLTEVETIKANSRLLRGSLEASLADPLTGAIAPDDTQVSKFHGIYQQDDRDVRSERSRQKLEPAYSFMIRVRVPAGICTPEQWLALDQLAQDHANGSLRLTTRQAVQFHGVTKGGLQTTIRGIDRALLDTLAACGDVNRNVICTPISAKAAVQREAAQWADRISEHLTPRTRAYHEVWLNGEKIDREQPEEEPIYGPTYLPRKFKIALAIPPYNDVDVFAQDLGFIAIEEAGELVGFNVTLGGGMGMTHGEPATYPRLADVIGFCTTEDSVGVAEAVVKIQRHYGDRTDRKHARLKYTIDDNGLDWFRDQLSQRGVELDPARPFSFDRSGDRFGWFKDDDGLWNVTLFIPSGRVVDHDRTRHATGLRAVAARVSGDFRITPNQNLILTQIREDEKATIVQLLDAHGIDSHGQVPPVRRNALACVALPTCALAMAEAERYLPALVDRLETLLDRHGLGQEDLLVRMTGCPNGCARPYLADIALVGKAPGRYNLMLGGGRDGARLNRLYRANLDEAEILGALDDLLADYIKRRDTDEPFSDFVLRTADFREEHRV